MNKLSITTGIVAMALSLSSCGELNGTLLGASVGTAVGADLGAGIGKVADSTGAGAAIGAVVGDAAGALISSRVDKQKKELEQRLPEGTQVESIDNGQAIKVVFDSDLLSNASSSTLSSSLHNDLHKLAGSLNKNHDAILEIIDHTDSLGSDRISDPLSRDRAKSARDLLGSQGVSSTRVRCEGHGSHGPVDTNAITKGKHKDRHVEIFISPNQKIIEKAKADTLK